MNRIKKARILAGFDSANAAAMSLGLDQSYFSKLEKADDPTVSGKMAVRLADGFGVTTDQILGRVELPEFQAPTQASA